MVQYYPVSRQASQQQELFRVPSETGSSAALGVAWNFLLAARRVALHARLR